jgi:hypothetical protein
MRRLEPWRDFRSGESGWRGQSGGLGGSVHAFPRCVLRGENPPRTRDNGDWGKAEPPEWRQKVLANGRWAVLAGETSGDN